MSWIRTIGYKEAQGKLKNIYKRLKGPNDTVDNVLTVHSLRPHTLVGHMTLYKSVLHHSGNTLPKWYLEAIGVYVSHLNHCSYCVEHHYVGLKRLFTDDAKATQLFEALRTDSPDAFFSTPYAQGLAYAKKLTLTPKAVVEVDVSKLKASGFSEGEILEINQVTSYFNYVNRTVLGLGTDTKGDILGLSPNASDEPENWSHS
ncbi:peroxidase-related enzyme [Flavobacteriaceae bacterium 3-367]